MIIGATGAVGKHLLRELLASDKFTRVGEFGRKVTPADNLPGKEKLQQTVVDFEKLDSEAIKRGNWDVVFITSVQHAPIGRLLTRRTRHIDWAQAVVRPDLRRHSRRSTGSECWSVDA